MRVLALLFVKIALGISFSYTFCNGESAFCIRSESQALLNLKKDLKDPSNRLSSWTSEGDCCKWAGVVCDNSTGHVLELHLRNPALITRFGNVAEWTTAFQREQLGGEINPSLLSLKHLRYIDLSVNDFEGIQIPKFFGSLESLTHLNLSKAGFGGVVPPQLGNLSNLQYLNLGDLDQGSYIDNLQWISGLSLLQHLDLTSQNLSKASNWLQVVNSLPSLLQLHLGNCELQHISPLPHVNFTSLAVLDLSLNPFNSLIPDWIFSLDNLVSLNLRSCGFQGPIPIGLRNMNALRELNLVNNNFNSTIPDSLYSLSHLEFIDLSNSNFHGTISSAIGNLTSAISLNLAFNNLQGRLPKSMGKLCNLRIINLSGFKLEVSEVTELLSRCVSDGLEELTLEENQISGQLADVIDRLGESKHLTHLSLSNNSFFGSIPESLGRLASLKLLALDINKLTGALPVSLGQLTMLEDLWLSHNELDGVMLEAHFENLTRLRILHLSDNLISGSLSNFLCYKMGDPMNLELLNIEGNLLSGEIPDCWMNWQSLRVIILDNNNLTGNLPASLGSLSNLWSFHLRNNRLSGELPASLQNCTELIGIDLSQNELFGSIPNWVGERLPKLRVLNLRLNRFSDHIPFALCALASLQILDIASNNLSGTIPKCFNNFSALTTNLSSSGYFFYVTSSLVYQENALLMMKGNMLEYSTILPTLLDLSDNHFSGDIPSELTSLLGLRSLNLSRNQLSGKIPEEIGKMIFLESIDLSFNQLSGEIPQTMSSLTFLSFLNLSYNNLSGRIPFGPQLQTFKGSSFVGNHLCGLPLDKNCSTSGELPSVKNVVEDADGLEVYWFYVTIALGFVVGFWGVCGLLLFKKDWRLVYFDFLDRIGHKLWSC